MKKNIKLVFLVFFSSVVAICFCEWLYRLYIYSKLKESGASMARKSEDKDLVLELIPNGLFKKMGIEYKINSMGFRWREITEKKQESFLRLIVVGDSIPMGLGVDIEDSFPFRLESILNSAMKKDKSQYEIVNTGTFFYDIKTELALLRVKLMKLNPDMILLSICTNDSVFIKEFLPGNPFGVMNKVSYFEFLYNHSLLWRALYDFLYQLKDSAKLKVYTDSRSVIEGKNFDEYKKYLGIFMNACTIAKIKLAIVIFPTRDQIINNVQDSQPFIKKYAIENGYHVLDLIDVYRKYDVDDIYLKWDNVHPSKYGNGIAAEAINKFLHDEIF